MMVHTLYYDRQ